MDLDTICQKLLPKVVLKEPHPNANATRLGFQLEFQVNELSRVGGKL